MANTSSTSIRVRRPVAKRRFSAGLKTKNVDVVINKDGLGPVLAVSCKGMTGAFRNLTNRMEETIGECTNLHITYPALVFGYLFIIRANRKTDPSDQEIPRPSERQVRQIAPNDIALMDSDRPVESIIRFHSALGALTGRCGIREDASRYEAISLAMIDTLDSGIGQPLSDFPPADSPLRLEISLKPSISATTSATSTARRISSRKPRRIEWSPDSPALNSDVGNRLDYEIRLSSDPSAI